MISLLFATRNRQRTLCRMLDAFLATDADWDRWEIIAIDNGSTDGTADVLKRYQSRLPITMVSCSRRGKNIALNAGLERARGQLLVFTDDDVLPERDWLRQLSALALEHPSVQVFGGRVHPEWPCTPPRWIIDHVDLSSVFTVHPVGLPEGADLPWAIWGPNMMVRADVFRAGYRFNESIGPAAGSYVMGSETEFVRRLSAAGYRCCFSNRPTVRHIVRHEQLQRKWILKRARRFGRQLGFLELESGVHSEAVPVILGVPRWRVRSLAADYIKSIMRGRWFATEASFELCWKVEVALGFLLQYRAVTRQDRRVNRPHRARAGARERR